MSRKSDIEQGILRLVVRLPVERVAFTMNGVQFEAEWPDHSRPFEIVSPYDAVSDLGDLVRGSPLEVVPLPSTEADDVA